MDRPAVELELVRLRRKLGWIVRREGIGSERALEVSRRLDELVLTWQSMAVEDAGCADPHAAKGDVG